MPVVPTFYSAYFSEATVDFTVEGWDSAFMNGDDSYVLDFPYSDQYVGRTLMPFHGSSDIPRIYSFVPTGHTIRVSNISHAVYRVDINTYDGYPLTEDEMVSVGYSYVYAWSNGILSQWSYTVYYIPPSQLPPGLSYPDFVNPPLNTENDGIFFLYSLGDSVYNFFPSIASLTKLDISGYTFINLLTASFTVYAAFVIIKFLVGIIP